MALNQFPRRSFVGSSTLQTFTGNGTQTVFTLSSAQTQNEVFLFVDDVVQVPGVDFTVNGTTLTFTVAPANNAEIIVRGFGVPAPVTTVSDGSVTAAKLATGAIEAKLGYTPVSPSQLSTEVAALVDSAPSTLNTLNELAAALGDDPNYATTITTALAAKANTTDVNSALALKATITSSTGAMVVPSGTTAQRPAEPSTGFTRYNTTTGSLEFYNGTTWVNTNLIPVLSSISGTIYSAYQTSLSINISNFTDTITVRFIDNGVIIADVTGVLVSGGTATVTVPSAVFNQPAGDVINISVINQDGTPSSNSLSRTVEALPTGGTITTSGIDRIHTFTSSSNFVVPSGFSRTASYLIVAGGGGGGGAQSSNDCGGGGGGAGGMLTGTTTISAQTYSITVGAGGSGGGEQTSGSNGANSVALGLTAIGGGGGAARSGGGGSTTPGNGGSGGGGTCTGLIGLGTAGQGNNGGGGSGTPAGASYGGGGKGGTGSVGSNGGGGAGGAGEASSISGTSLFYAGGGGGGEGNGPGGAGAGGSGVGGNGSENSNNSPRATDGMTNRGGGGGGNGGFSTGTGGAGGSGVVIIRYTV